ncbi:MAG: hypothetical protein CVU29_11880 [Betaproteobacteria bacterium HGW-Betaproteobacteria-22]|nr:MAG: hypothetical protein CVU29_11880 [Betaproteobacteria bacterium HGW-Betaproteobacteria-22]
MAITFINKSRLDNNLWVEPRGAYSETISAYLALNHNQYWVINGAQSFMNLGYQGEVSTIKLDALLGQWTNAIDLSSLDEQIAVAYIYGSGGAATTVMGNGPTYANQNVIYFNINTGTEFTSNLTIGTWGGYVAMHEIGHVLGLENNGTGDHGLPTNDLRQTIMKYPVSYTTDGV